MMTILSLGMFIRFEVEPLSFETFDMSNNARQVSQNVLGARPSQQFLGAGEKTWNIGGKIFPNALGYGSYKAIEAAQNAGMSLMMVGSTGKVYGWVVITSLSERHRHINPDGSPGVIEFDISLKQDGDFNPLSMLLGAANLPPVVNLAINSIGGGLV